MENQVVVLDNGSGNIKAGFAGQLKPELIVPTVVGRPKNPRCLPSDLPSDIVVGDKAIASRGLLSLSYPIEHGIVVNWDNLQLLWSYIFQGLKLNGRTHPLLVTEPPLNPRSNREKLMETAFEYFGVPSMAVSMEAVLALYASGRTTGIVLNCGDGVSNAVPIVEGFTIVHSIKRSDLAGRDVTEYLCNLIRLSGKVLHTSAEFEIVRDIKENACMVSPSVDNPERDAVKHDHLYKLPDGTSIMIGPERWRAPEILFQPSLFGYEYPGVHQLLSSAIARTELDLRKELACQILLTGGSTLMSGFVDRVLGEMRKTQPKEAIVRIYAPPERHLAAYSGGGILASLSTFKNQLITRSQYDEAGGSLLTRKQL